MDGIVIIHKRYEWTSMDVLKKIKCMTKIKKVGHAGTLDPLASGVLIVALGKGTKQISKLQDLPKAYQATINLSATSETDDAQGPIHPTQVNTIPTLTDIQTTLNKHFTGIIEQLPPNYSAIKIGGQRAYNMMRSNIEFKLKPRPVTIHAISIVSYTWPNLILDIQCSKGTYIRSIARDLGQYLATGGYLTGLIRTAIGPFTLEQAHDVSGKQDFAPSWLISLEQITEEI